MLSIRTQAGNIQYSCTKAWWKKVGEKFRVFRKWTVTDSYGFWILPEQRG